MLSYCYIVTERHASSTSSPKWPPIVLSQRGDVSYNFAPRAAFYRHKAQLGDSTDLLFAKIDVPNHGVDCIHRKSDQAPLQAIATATASI